MKYSDLKGKPVVDVASAEKLGNVSDLYINLQEQRVVGLQVNVTALFSRDRALLWSDLQSIGENAVTVPRTDLVRNVKAVPVVSDLAQIGDIVGDKMMTESGSDIGTAADIEIDGKTGAITSYVLRSGFLEGLQRREQLIPSGWVKRIGKKIIVVQDQATSESSQT